MRRELRWAKDGPSRRAHGTTMACGKPSKARPNGGASLFGYLLGRLPKVTRRKGEKVAQEQYKFRLSASVQKPKIKSQSRADRAQQAIRHVGSRDADSNLQATRFAGDGLADKQQITEIGLRALPQPHSSCTYRRGTRAVTLVNNS